MARPGSLADRFRINEDTTDVEWVVVVRAPPASVPGSLPMSWSVQMCG
jgi:hypothetical protein